MKRFLCIYLLSSFSFFSCGDNPVKQAESETLPSMKAEDDSWTLQPFVKIDSANPVLQPDSGVFFCPVRKRKIMWENKDVFNPAIVVKNNKIFMLYRAQDKIGNPGGTSRIGLATSEDGIHFIRKPSPVLFPDNDDQKKYEWEGGCEDPRIVEDSNGTYFMTYTAYDGNLARLMVATSKDLEKWTKYGPVFKRAYHGKYLDLWSKSGSIVSKYINGKIVATKINDKYWMYWGDQNIWAAVSDDLINWTPVEMSPGEKPSISLIGQAVNMPDLRIVVPTREKKFDSYLVESGPPAMYTEAGILLIYNSRNNAKNGDSTVHDSAYAAGQVLFDKNDPTKILRRTDHCFMKPDKPYEIEGQVNQVCFLEGLAQFHDRYFLYYGTADSKIAVAVK